MGGVILYYQPEAMLEQYDIEIRQITKGRGAFVCETDDGMRLLSPFRGSKERAQFVRNILQQLKKNGYPVEQIYATREDECIVTDESGIRFWLKDLVEGSECQTNRERDLLAGCETLAGFHRAAALCAGEIPEFMQNTKNEPQQLYRRHYKELIQVKNYVLSRKTKNEFERSFFEQYPHYISQAKAAVQLLEQHKEAESVRGLCHGECTQHNLLSTKKGVRLVNFENMCYGEPVVDLANFLRKIMEKNNWNIALGRRLIDAYEKERPLQSGERKLLYKLLLFPEKFWKVTNHYSNSHKAWVSGRDIEKLKRLIAMEPDREYFLENLFPFL